MVLKGGLRNYFFDLKETNFNYVHRGLIEMGPKGKESRQLLYFLDKETINSWGNDTEKKLRFGVIN